MILKNFSHMISFNNTFLPLYLYIVPPLFLCLLVDISLFSVSLSLLSVLFTSFIFLDSTYKWCHTVFVWLISLSIMLSEFFHVVANGKILFVWMSSIPLCVYVCVCACTCVHVYHSFFILSFVDEHFLAFFHTCNCKLQV